MNLDMFIKTLPVVLWGMAGIFVVMGIMFLGILCLGKLKK